MTKRPRVTNSPSVPRARSRTSAPKVSFTRDEHSQEEAGPGGEPLSEPAQATTRGPVRVELMAAIGGWPAQSRFDVVLRGQITSATPVDSFSIRDPLGLELAGVQFGHGDEQGIVTLSGGDTAFRAGFQVYLPMPGGEAIRISDLWVRARATDGSTFDESMRIGCMADQAAILAGPAHEMDGTTIPPPRGIVYLESAEVSADGMLLVHGWALATSAIVAVQIFVDGERVGAATQGRERGDVADAYPGYPNAKHSGFSLERTLGRAIPGPANVTAQVLCLSGACHTATIPSRRATPEAVPAALPPRAPELSTAPDASDPPTAPRPAETPRPGQAAELAELSGTESDEPAWDLGRAILLICDQALVAAGGLLRVEGWTACGHGIERIAIEVNGVHAGDAEYGRERPDVASEYPGMPIGTGFGLETTIPELEAGSHEIRILVISGAGDKKEMIVVVTPPPADAFRFELDGPVTRDGVVVQPITGRLMIEGWALARDGVAGIDVELNGALLGQAHYGMARPDVGSAFPDWNGAARSGYTFHCPSRALPDGEHVMRIVLRSKIGETHAREFQITVRKTDNPEEAASIRRRIKLVERNTLTRVLKQLNWRPAFHLIVIGDKAAGEPAMALTIRSILEQSWAQWRVTYLASTGAEAVVAGSLINRLAHEQSPRFVVTDPSEDGWDDTLTSGAEASLIGVLAAGDELGRDALGAFAVWSGLHPDADCFYADEFRMAPGAARPEAFFKPDFSPALLLSMNYIGRPLVVRPALLAKIGATVEQLARDGFHDLALRCTEAATEIRHVTELLSRTDGGAPSGSDDGALALERAMERRGIAAEVTEGAAPGMWRVKRTTPITGKVSIIIPTCAAKGYIETCLRTLRAVTSYKNFEIVCVDNIPASETTWKQFIRDHADKVVDMPEPFNWSRFNNAAAASTDGEYLLFLNDDIEIVQPDWLDAILEAAAWPDTGIVGARLLYPGRTVQHAGMFLGDGMGRHAFRHADEAELGYFGFALTKREVIAVTGACLLVRRDVFDRLGRFDEAHVIVNNDLDFCLRAHSAGLRTIYTPHATLIHHELTSRDHLTEDFDTTRFSGEWHTLFAAGDPYFNPHLSRYADDYRVDDEGVRVMYAGHPLVDRASVKAILVVKVDHIGDFITSLPAIRRLKAAFPGARLTALVAPASASIAAIEPAIDECIPFEFFHARSELGDKELTQGDLDALTALLAPYRFDIAVDLRKHLSTRHLLLCAGAKLLAGYDSLESFPWLDIVLEWEGDKALQRKRSHIVDDLMTLTTTISEACEPNRHLFDPKPEPMTMSELPAHVRHLFARPVVAIHPGAGNVMKQWPERHMRALISLLLERDDVAVLLVGGDDDTVLAASIIEHVSQPDRIASVAGSVSLRDLPRLFAACTLFIGCDSGPKHIAAASGIPTIGVHSGIVDSGEWGPVGDRAVALYRDMSCSPCFLAKPDHCPRGLACVELLDPALVHKTARMFLATPVRDRIGTKTIEVREPVARPSAKASVLGRQPNKRIQRAQAAASE
jgi:ADP-heptose:LPS heptosyltransferase/GT2 family glycosyltransferase